MKLPLATICEMMGVGADMWSQIHAWTTILFPDPALTDSPRPRESMRDMRRRMMVEFEEWIFELIDQRRAEGATGPDLVSILLRSELKGRPLTPQELLGYIRLLIAAGNETTRNASTGGMIALLEHPDELAYLVEHLDDPEVVDVGRRGDPAVDVAGHPVRPNLHRGHRTRRPDHQSR